MINDREEEEEAFRDSIVQETVGSEWDAAETAFVVLQESTSTFNNQETVGTEWDHFGSNSERNPAAFSINHTGHFLAFKEKKMVEMSQIL